MAAVVSGPAEDQARLAAEPKQLFDADDHIDIEALLSRPRALGRRRQRPLYKAPEFVKRLGAFEEVEVGKDVVFECQWKSFPKPEFQWFKDDADITHDPRYQVKEGDNGVLTLYIRRVTKKDEGTYKCRVENCEGSNTTTGDVKDKVLSAQPRRHADHAVSFPPCLRTIIEQQSLEELEAEDFEPVTPPPLRADTWPLMGHSAPESGPQADDNSLALVLRGQSALTPEDDKDDESDTSVDSQGDLERVSFRADTTEEVHPVETTPVQREVYPAQAEQVKDHCLAPDDVEHRVSFKRPVVKDEDVERVQAKVPLVYDASKLDEAAPIAGDEDFDSLSLSSQNTFEPDIFTMDDIEENKSRETSRSRESSVSFDLRPTIPVNEPPRFNTPRLRTPTPPLLPRFTDDPHTRTPLELGPTLISSHLPAEPEMVPDDQVLARHVPIMPNTPATLLATQPPKEDIIPEEPRSRLIRTGSVTIELVNTKEEQSDPLLSDTSDYGSTSSILSAYQDPMEYISPELRSLAEKTRPREDDFYDRDLVPESPTTRERLSLVSTPQTPFPWAWYTIFALCCGFFGSVANMSPSGFVMLVALLSIISFRYTLTAQD